MLDTLLKHLPMVRLSAGVLVALALTACNGLIDGNGAGSLTPEQQVARTAWTNEAWPHLQQQCVGCHSGSEADIAFLAGGDALKVHDALMGFNVQIVNTDAPGSSRLLTKGAHAGPALTAEESADILDWIQKERDAVGGGSADMGLETGQFQPLLCTAGNPGDATCPVNHVALDGVGLPGATIDLVAQPLGSALYVTDLKLSASVDGVYLEHPLFVSWPANAQEVPDSLDRFFNIKMNEMPMAADEIGGGTAAFVGMNPNDPVSIHFKAITKYMADSTGGTGGTGGQTGCRQLASFKQNAAGPLQAQCASCHAGTANANAKSAMDITGVNAADDATVLNACNQVRTRINFQDTNSSSFYIAPNPSQTTNHPFKFGGVQANFDNFKAAIDPWVQAEKTSQ